MEHQPIQQKDCEFESPLEYVSRLQAQTLIEGVQEAID